MNFLLIRKLSVFSTFRKIICIGLMPASIFFSTQFLPERHKVNPTEKYAKRENSKKKGQNVRIVFYNTENLYDPYDDSTKMDDEFTRDGKKKWSYNKFSIKVAHLAKTLIAAGGQEVPGIIGLCEVENRYVLNKIIYDSPLKKFNYRFIHYESPDKRGIDVALLYRSNRFRVISSAQIRIRFPADTNIHTRDILYVCGVLFGEDTLHLFVNHWPSRLGGKSASDSRRNYVASVLKGRVDSILKKNNQASIVLMGDFNDEPDQPSIRDVLNAGPYRQEVASSSLINLMAEKQKEWMHGTHKFRGKWSIIDQFIVSGSMMLPGADIATSPGDAGIFSADFLQEKETVYFGSRPLRTYAGPRYLGGFSDHLPITLDLWKR